MTMSVILAVLFGGVLAGAGLLSNHPFSAAEIGLLAVLGGVAGAGVWLLLTPLVSAVTLKESAREEED